MLERGITPSELMKKGGVEKANERIYNEVKIISDAVDAYVESNLSKYKNLQDADIG
jgi:hypothetical protein